LPIKTEKKAQFRGKKKPQVSFNQAKFNLIKIGGYIITCFERISDFRHACPKPEIINPSNINFRN